MIVDEFDPQPSLSLFAGWRVLVKGELLQLKGDRLGDGPALTVAKFLHAAGAVVGVAGEIPLDHPVGLPLIYALQQAGIHTYHTPELIAAAEDTEEWEFVYQCESATWSKGLSAGARNIDPRTPSNSIAAA